MQRHTSRSRPRISFILPIHVGPLFFFFCTFPTCYFLWILSASLFCFIGEYLSVGEPLLIPTEAFPTSHLSAYHYDPHILIQYMPVCISQDASLLTHETGVVQIFLCTGCIKSDKRAACKSNPNYLDFIRIWRKLPEIKQWNTRNRNGWQKEIEM